ncbi:MAG: helix-turn-helix transcriptional regulator [Terriglobus sp.]
MAPNARNTSLQKKKNNGMAMGTLEELLHKTMTPKQIADARKKAQAILGQMSLEELRKGRKVTQSKLAAAMGVDQGEVSKIEKRTELKLGTLTRYVSGLGGHLEVRAVFPDQNVELSIRG